MVAKFSQDPIINVIHDSMRDGINLYKNPNSKEAKLADKRFQTFVHKLPTDDVMSGGND